MPDRVSVMRRTIVPAPPVLSLVVVTMAGFAAIIVICGGIGRVGSLLTALEQHDLVSLRSQLHSLGDRAALALVVLVIIHTVIPFPAELVEAAGGFALGALTAIPLLLVSFLASSVFAYFLGLWVGRPVARGLVGAHRLGRAEHAVQSAGARGLLALRLFPLIPFSPLCFACGLARVPFRRYLWTTAVGILPELVLVAIVGWRLQALDISDPATWAATCGICLLAVVAPTILRTRSRPSQGHGDGIWSEVRRRSDRF